MVKMTISQDAINFLRNRGYDKHEIILIVDGGGGVVVDGGVGGVPGGVVGGV